jgi:ACS family sodium-dependent inorganic phosphate cotransporter-like MFS transporter 5
LLLIADGLGFRHVQVLLIFLCLTIAYAQRVNMSVAIVAITDKNSTNPDFPEYEWTEQQKSMILSSFFWGYVVTQIPGGQLAKNVGGKVMLLVAIALCSLLNLLTPLFASFGFEAVVALRVVQGLCQGCIFPSTHTLLAKWVRILIRKQMQDCSLMKLLRRHRQVKEERSEHTAIAVRSLAQLSCWEFRACSRALPWDGLQSFTSPE